MNTRRDRSFAAAPSDIYMILELGHCAVETRKAFVLSLVSLGSIQALIKQPLPAAPVTNSVRAGFDTTFQKKVYLDPGEHYSSMPFGSAVTL